MTTSSWYSTGYDAAHKEEARMQSMREPRRFWMPAGSSRQLVTVDEVPFNIREHNAKLNGNWRNWHTCNRGFEDSCFSCVTLGEKTAAFTAYLTIVDCSEFVDKKGNKYQFEVKLIGGKLMTAKKWERKRSDLADEQLTFAGMRWKVHRENDKAPSTGDEWTASGPVTDHAKLFAVANYQGKKLSDLWDRAEQNEDAMKVLSATFQLQLDPNGKLVRRVPAFNYMELLKPKGNVYAKDLLNNATPSDDEDEGSGGGKGAEDDIPF